MPVGAARKDENEDYATKHANAELQRLNAELHRVNARLQRQYNDLLVVLEKSKGQENPTWKEVHDATASREILKAELNLWKRIAAESQFENVELEAELSRWKRTATTSQFDFVKLQDFQDFLETTFKADLCAKEKVSKRNLKNVLLQKSVPIC
ncbi:MAG: hypothetical protein ACREBR_02395 [bacterium]